MLYQVYYQKFGIFMIHSTMINGSVIKKKNLIFCVVKLSVTSSIVQ